MHLYLITSLVLSFLVSLLLGFISRKYLFLVASFILGGFFGLSFAIAYIKMTPLPAWIANLSGLLAVRPLLLYIVVFSPTVALLGGVTGVYVGKRETKQEVHTSMRAH